MPDIAIIIPAYDESQTIANIILQFHEVAPEAFIAVVDNNSSDGTGEIAKQTIAENQIIGSVIFEPRQGKGNALRRAFSNIEADVYVMVDADCTYPSERVHDLIAPILSGQAHMVIGDRHTGGDYGSSTYRHFHNFGNKLVRWLVNRLFNSDLHDILSGYRAFSRIFIHNYPILVGGFEIETDMTLHALDKRFRILEIPVNYIDRPSGSSSKLHTFSDGSRVLLTIFRIFRYYKPMAFFGSFSALLALSMCIAGYPVIEDWLVHRYIYHVPSAILASGLGLMASLSLCLGLILDSNNHQYRMRFERDITSMERGID